MPCYDERNSPEYIAEEYQAKLNAQMEQINDLTDMLCEAMQIVERTKSKWSTRLDRWWTAHKKADAERKARELKKIELAWKAKVRKKAREELIKKLTKSERDLLGV